MPASTATTAVKTAAPKAPPAARTPKDPEAAALAAAARDLARAAGLKSAYAVGEGREVLDRFTVERTRGALKIAKDNGEAQPVKIAVLRAFIAKTATGDDDTKAAAKLMAELAQGTKGTLYGRKLAAFLLARAA